jgi:hypothetical protein
MSDYHLYTPPLFTDSIVLRVSRSLLQAHHRRIPDGTNFVVISSSIFHVVLLIRCSCSKYIRNES